MSKSSITWNYTYDANGMRTSRSNGTKTYNYVYNGSQLTQMTVGNDTLYFTYGVLGPTTVTWNGETYYYAVNAQGDVTGIFDGNGNLVVLYNWDNAWGYNPAPEGSLASTLGTLNPLRYRGYVYDTETGYYYLQSRYYDPEIGRFINSDAFVATGQGLLGNNMFAYCGNNPVSRYDPTGKRYCMVHVYDGGGGGSSSGAISQESTASRLASIINNQSEAVTQESLRDNGFGFYKGTLVITADILPKGSAFSFGLIALDDMHESTTLQDFSTVLKHEYGHAVHLQQVGLPTYAVTTAFPSLIGAGLASISDYVYANYYNLPWERVADYLGGVNRGYVSGANTCGSLFWLYTYVVGHIEKGAHQP